MSDTYRLQTLDDEPLRAAPLRSEPSRFERRGKMQTPVFERLTSLDAYRGFIMLLLAAGGFGIAALCKTSPDDRLWTVLRHSTWMRIGFHFNHPAWGSSFLPGATTDAQAGSPWYRVAISLWDLIQPAFMFMVGMAMVYSEVRRTETGATNWQRWRHAVWRSVILTLLGVFLSSLNSRSHKI